jgi:hypothetical protein
MLGNCLLNLNHESPAVTTRVVTDRRHAMYAKILKLGGAWAELSPIAPQPGNIFRHDDCKFPASSRMQKRLVSGSLCRTSRYAFVLESRDNLESGRA